MIGPAGAPAIADSLAGRAAATLAVEPAIGFDELLGSLDQTGSQGGIAALPKPSARAAASFGQLGFFEAGPGSAPSDDQSPPDTAHPPGVVPAPSSAGPVTGAPSPPLVDTPMPDAGSGGAADVTVMTSEAGERVEARPEPHARSADQAGAPIVGGEPRRGSVAEAVVAGRPLSSAGRFRVPQRTATPSVRIEVASGSASASAPVAVAIKARLLDDGDTAVLGDAVRGLLARHGLILGRFTINGRPAAAGTGQGGS